MWKPSARHHATATGTDPRWLCGGGIVPALHNNTKRFYVRNPCESKTNERQFQTILDDFHRGESHRRSLAVAVFGWWSWGDSNPRPRAFTEQIYMFSGLI